MIGYSREDNIIDMGLVNVWLQAQVSNIERALLLMVSSTPKYIDMTFLKFLFLLVDNRDVQRIDIIEVKGASSAFTVLLRKE